MCKKCKIRPIHKTARIVGNRSYWCLECRRKDYRRHNGYRYGLSVDQLAAFIQIHQNRCAICGDPPSQNGCLNIDHDHRTNSVRGMLCRKCNTALGLVGDSISRLRRMIEYVESGGFNAVPEDETECRQCGSSLAECARNAKYCSRRCRGAASYARVKKRHLASKH